MNADPTTASSPDATRLEWQRWRLERDTSVAMPGGWLSLTGFAWLATEPEPVDRLPGKWWTDGQQTYAGAVQADGVVLEDEVIDGIVRTYDHDDLRQQIRLDGEITFELDGQEASVRGSDNRDGTWRFAFQDQSNGAGTARWRTVATTPVDADGGVEFDSDRTITLPFAFGEFGTCPAPPPGNVLPLAVTAGEKAAA